MPDPAPPVKRYVLRTAAPARAYRVDYTRELNAEQREVVFAPDGPTIVIAGAGSGKTRTLVYRVSRLVEDGIAPQRLCLLTFTTVSYTHLRAHETRHDLVCRLLLEKKKK